MQVRRDKRERMLDRGRRSLPAQRRPAPTRCARSSTAYDAEALGPDHHTGDQVAVTGRVIFLRNTGKLCFARLREGDGTEIQAMFSLADLGEESLAEFKSLVDIGD